MRVLLSVIFVLLLLTATLANNPAIFVSNYADAISLAKHTDLQVLLIFSSDPCPPCIKLKNSITDINDIIICDIDISDTTNKNLVNKFKISSVPESILLDKSENQIRRLKGFVDKISYKQWLFNK